MIHPDKSAKTTYPVNDLSRKRWSPHAFDSTTLDEGNKAWVKTVPVLMLSIGKKVRGLFVHQMGGSDPEMAILEFDIPSDHQPLKVIALGYPGDPSILSPENIKSELAARTRKDFNEFVFPDKFGQKSTLSYEE